jgi:hypothetical protein
LDEALFNADVVALAMPNTSETALLFNKARMLEMKKRRTNFKCRTRQRYRPGGSYRTAGK